MKHTAVSFTAAELAARGLENLPDELVSAKHLIYSSPATLAFNSPGAEGFGVKRAGLAIPGSVMLVVAPGCCGRNTSLVSNLPGYEGRFFYLNMSETDIVTGRHLKKIPQAVCEVVDACAVRPSVVMICITCVDALLGTDMERVCRAAEALAGVPVKPCYMYALTREGRRPPMVHVRQSIYSLLEPLTKRPSSVNLLGFFAPVEQDCELFRYLREMGVKRIREVSTCDSYDDFLHMAEANFNLVLHPEARFAATDLQERLGIPSIELTRLYQLDRIQRQYQALGRVLGTSFDDAADYAAAEADVQAFAAAVPGASFALGECLNGDPFELAVALLHAGFAVREIFGTVSAENFVWVRYVAELSPETRVYSNMDPSMIYYRAEEHDVAFALGKDARWYHPEALGLDWNSDAQPYGYAGVKALFEALLALREGEAGANRTQTHKAAVCAPPSNAKGSAVAQADARLRADRDPSTPLAYARSAQDDTGLVLGESAAHTHSRAVPGDTAEGPAHRRAEGHTHHRVILSEGAEGHTHHRVILSEGAEGPEAEGSRAAAKPQDGSRRSGTRGLRTQLTPFAPDQSGAVSVLFELGGIIVIVDAGGCTGNICGFDEPRWHDTCAAVFSAGLRDMDAILGRDDALVAKLYGAAHAIDARFAAIVGTPVPSVIGTDYRALKRLAARNVDLPILTVDTTGMALYDVGAAKAYEALFSQFATEAHPVEPGRIGVIGANPLDLGITRNDALVEAVPGAVCYGMGAGLAEVERASAAERNIVVAPSGLRAAKLLQERFGTPYEVYDPLARAWAEQLDSELADARVLVVNQQVSANTLREELQARGAASVVCATWFGQAAELTQAGDVRLREEDDFAELVEQGGFDLIIADPVLRPLAGRAARFIDLPQFAVSGKLVS